MTIAHQYVLGSRKRTLRKALQSFKAVRQQHYDLLHHCAVQYILHKQITVRAKTTYILLERCSMNLNNSFRNYVGGMNSSKRYSLNGYFDNGAA